MADRARRCCWRVCCFWCWCWCWQYVCSDDGRGTGGAAVKHLVLASVQLLGKRSELPRHGRRRLGGLRQADPDGRERVEPVLGRVGGPASGTVLRRGCGLRCRHWPGVKELAVAPVRPRRLDRAKPAAHQGGTSVHWPGQQPGRVHLPRVAGAMWCIPRCACGGGKPALLHLAPPPPHLFRDRTLRRHRTRTT